MKLWTSDPNLHLSLADTNFCFLSCFVVRFLACLPFRLSACHLVCLLSLLLICLHSCYTCHIYLACSLCVILLLSTHFYSIACLLVSCLFLCMYAHGARTHGARAWSSKCKQKGAITSMGQMATVNRFSVQSFPLVMYSFKPPPSSSLSPLDGLYQVYHALYHSSSSLKYGDPYLLSCIYILGHALGMQAFTFLLCVLALCIMHIYIYLLAPIRCDYRDPCHLRLAMPTFRYQGKVTSHRIFVVEIWHFA